MIKLGERNFILASGDGEDVPFSISWLQSELIGCFLNAGMGDSSCFAEDIALAIEYALEEIDSFSGRVNCAELNDLVIETLDNAGFAPVAEWFRKRNLRKIEVFYSTSFGSLSDIAVRQGLTRDAELDREAIAECCEAFAAMKTDDVPLGLAIEMLKFHLGRKNSSIQNTGRIVPEKIKKGDYLVEIERVVHLFPEYLHLLIEKKVLKFNNITVYHPSIRIHADFNAFAEMKGLKGVLTEMFWAPYALELGESIDAAIEILQNNYTQTGGSKELPVYLTVNGMSRFAAVYFGADGEKMRDLGNYLVDGLAQNMFNSFYKVKF